MAAGAAPGGADLEQLPAEGGFILGHGFNCQTKTNNLTAGSRCIWFSLTLRRNISRSFTPCCGSNGTNYGAGRRAATTGSPPPPCGQCLSLGVCSSVLNLPAAGPAACFLPCIRWEPGNWLPGPRNSKNVLSLFFRLSSAEAWLEFAGVTRCGAGGWTRRLPRVGSGAVGQNDRMHAA